MELITLAAGESRLTLAPEIGGSVVSWLRGKEPIFRPPLADALDNALARGLAAYPLVPYSNRIDGGRMHVDGGAYQLPATSGGHAIHGVGWQNPWTVAMHEPTRATLTLNHIPDKFWPFAFRAEQRFVLEPNLLICHLLIQSLHSGPVPTGLGLHPYFPRSPAATLEFVADAVWVNRPDMIPKRRTKVPTRWDHTLPRRLGTVALDNCFVGWHGQARIAYPDRGFAIAITAEPIFRHLVVFIPPEKNFIAVEPVTNMNDGVNRVDDTPGHGVCMLQPGETLEGRMVFTLESSSP